MSLTAPPRPREVDAPPQPDPFEALIEEARQHARRRRRRRWGAVLAFVAPAGVSILILAERSVMAPGGGTPGESVPLTTTRVKMHNGPLAIMATVGTASPIYGYTGWYGFSRIRTDGGLAPVVRCPGRQTAWCGEVESIDWSPDGTRLALSVSSVGAANPYNGLHVIDLGTGRDSMLRLGCCDSFDLDWSPDGTRIAYVTRNQIYARDEIHIVDARRRAPGEAEPRRLGRGDRPSWSPDGQWIAFSRAEAGRRSVYVVRPSGEDERLLVAGGSAPAWAPDGRTIAYRTDCRILLVTPNGSDVTPQRLRQCIRSGDSALGEIGPPVWSPDGRKLAFSAQGKDRLFGPAMHGTFVIDADGTNMRRVSASALDVVMGQQPRPAWRPVHAVPSGG